MRWFYYILPFILFTNCSKEPFYVPQPRLYMDLYFQATEAYTIEHGHFQLQLKGAWKDPQTGLINEITLKDTYFWKNSLPFEIELPIMQYRIDSLQSAARDATIAYYLNLRWDSDGNRQLCKGDLSFDYRMCSPYIQLTEQRQQLYLKRKTSNMGCRSD